MVRYGTGLSDVISIGEQKAVVHDGDQTGHHIRGAGMVQHTAHDNE